MTENELMAKVNEALVSANGVLDLTDTKGQRTLVPAHALGYVQIASKTERRVGFAIH
jgi:conserved domain protein